MGTIQKVNSKEKIFLYDNLGIKKNKWISLLLLLGILAINYLTCVIYNVKINHYLYNTKWYDSGINIVVIVEEQILPLIGYSLFILIAYMLLTFFVKLYELNISSRAIFNILLLFIGVLSLNDLVKLLGAGMIGVFENVSGDINQVFNQLKDLKGFSTGLDMFFNAHQGILQEFLESINIFSIMGICIINSQLKKVRKNNVIILISIAVTFIIINSLFNLITLNNFMVWSD